MEIEAGLIELYKDPTLDTKPKLLEERGGAFYSDAAAALVASLHAGTNDIQVVNVRNDGAIPNLPDDAVVEVSARVDRDGAHPLPVDALPPEMLGLVEHAKAYELLAARAATSGDRAPGPESAHDEPARERLRHREAAARGAAGREPRITCRGSLVAVRREGLTVGPSNRSAARRRDAGPSRWPRPHPRCLSCRRGTRSP